MKQIHLTQQKSEETKPAAVPANHEQPTVSSGDRGNSKLKSTEFLFELQSAASMIMSPEECAELAIELEMLRGPCAIHAA